MSALLLVVLCASGGEAEAMLAERVHFAFRREQQRLVAGHDTHRVEVDARGTVTFFPIADRDVGPGREALRLRVRALSRGEVRLDVRPRSLEPGASPDVVALKRADFTELVRNGRAGVEQSFRFDALPRGKGALVLELETDARYLGRTRTGDHFAAGPLSVAYGAATWVTADGTRALLTTTRTARGLRITVAADLLARSRFPAVIDPLLSAEFAVDSPVLTAPPTQQDGPVVAWDGTNYLVVWRDFRGGAGSDIYGTRVSTAGVMLDPGGLPLSVERGGQYQPALTFGAGQYYLTFSDTRAGGSDIYGTRVSTAGVSLDGTGLSLTNATGLQVNSDVAFNGTDYFVVWEDLRQGGNNSPDIYGTRVTTSGMVLDPAPNLPVSAALWGQYMPKLAAGSTNALVAWEDTRNMESDIYGALVDNGGAVTAAFFVNRATGTQDKADVAFNGTNYIVAWSDLRSGNRDVYAARVTTAGALLDMTGIPWSVVGGDQDAPSIDPSGLLAVWRDSRSGVASDIYATRVGNSGTASDPAGLLVSNSAGVQSDPDLVARSATEFFVTFIDTRVGNMDIFGTRFEAGVALDPLGVALNLAANQQGSVAIATDGTNFLVVWQDFRANGADLYGARFSAAGVRLDAPFVISSAPGDEQSPAATWDGVQYVVAWTDARAANSDIYAARVSQAGAVLDPLGIAVSTNVTRTESVPAVASLGTGAGSIVLWQDSRATNFDLYAARLAPNGTVLDPGGLPVSTASGDQTAARMIAFGAGYLVAWTDTRMGNSDIFAARLDGAGMVLDGTGIPVSTHVSNSDSVALAASSQALLSWRDGRNGAANQDIYAARLDVSGSVVDPMGFVITTAAGAQGGPALGWDRAASAWTVVWEDYATSAEGELWATEVTSAGLVTAPGSIGSGRGAAIHYSQALPGLLGSSRFVAGPGMNNFRVFLRLAGLRAAGASCTSGAQCVSGLCMTVCIGIGVDAGAADAGTDAGPDAGGSADAGVQDAGVADGGGVADAGRQDAGVADAGAVDGGPDAGGASDGGMRDGGASDAGGLAPRFVDMPATTARCGEAWHWGGTEHRPPQLTGTEPITFTLRDGPAAMTLEPDGRLTWVPSLDGVEMVTLVASNAAGEAEARFEIAVTCERRALGVGCGCGALEFSALAWLLLVGALRRRDLSLSSGG